MTSPPWTAVILQDGDWWIGWIAEVPGVNAQERSREGLLETLVDVLREALAHVGDRYEEVAVSL